MALMTWNNSYSVGVQSLDKEHAALFEILNGLYDAMKKGQAQVVTGPLLNKLVDYTRRHFATEEAIMTNTRFPKLAEHRTEHHSLIKQVEQFVSRFERGDVMLSIDLFNFLRDWLSTHILKMDKGYSFWMNEHGIR
ncbi:MAG: bacteriohemerythrin [Terracidiphilus sp.]|jgi:hemerythrin